jgi:hypothetical protein
LNSRACHPLAVALMLAILAGCRDQAKPPRPAGSPRPSFALPLAAGASPPGPAAPTVDALPPASNPLPVVLADGPDRYRLIDQALAASDAYAHSPPDYVVRYKGTPISVWRSDNGWIRAVERLDGGDRTYFYRALTEQPYLVAGRAAAYGYDRDALAAAYDGDGVALDSMAASRRVVAAARLLDRGRALHAAIMGGVRRPAHADWRIAGAPIEQQRLRWRRSLGQQANWRDWHEGDTADRESRWSAERTQRQAYAAALGAVPARLPALKQAEPVVVLAAAPASVTGAARAAEMPAKPATPIAPPTPAPASPPDRSRPGSAAAAGPKTATIRKDDQPRRRVGTKAKRNSANVRKHLRRPGRQLHGARAIGRRPLDSGQPAGSRPRHRTPKFLRDVGNFFDRTFGGGRDRVRVHRNQQPPVEE